MPCVDCMRSVSCQWKRNGGLEYVKYAAKIHSMLSEVGIRVRLTCV